VANPTYSLKPFAVDAAMLYSGANAFGQTRGGVTFDPGANPRDPEFDGVPPFVEDQARITSYNSRLTGRFGVFTPTFWFQLHAGGSSDGSSGNNAITPIDARTFIADTLADFRCIYRITGSNVFHAIVARRIRFHPWTVAGEDNNEGLFDGTIQFLADPADLLDPPYRIIAPFDLDTYDYLDYFSA
jgi:hypothetical protein